MYSKRFLTAFWVGLFFSLVLMASARAQSPPGVGDLVINEIMYNPSGGVENEPDHEWFEVKNVTGSALDANNCTISDNANTYTISGSPTIPAGGYFVFGRSNSIPGVTVDYVYGNIQLNNTGNDDITITCNSTVIDVVAYGTSSPWPSSTDGTSISFGVLTGQTDYATLNDSGSNWKHSTSTCCSGSDFGTPGAVNDDILGPTAITLSSFAAGRGGSLVQFGRARDATSRLPIATLVAVVVIVATLATLRHRRPTQ